MIETRGAWMDATLPVAERVELLLKEMTLDEKIMQLGSVWVYEVLDEGQRLSARKTKGLIGDGIGQITRPAGASTLGPAQVAALCNDIQKYMLEETRLGIPAMMHDECCAGVLARGATVFPQIIGLASTWRPDGVQQATEVIRKQMRALGIHHGLAPVLDIARDPRWGRIEETFGEDPYLTACMGVAYVRGLQGEDWSKGVVATGKHFIGYSLPEGGLNWAPAHIMPRELREVYLLPFEAAVKEAGLGTMMNSYNELDGVPAAASKVLLTDILRGEWGFQGMVVSDYFAIPQLVDYHHYAPDKATAARMTLDAGMDLELPSIDAFRQPLIDAVHSGSLDESRIDESVRRMLAAKFAFGLFENPWVEPEAVAGALDTPEQRTLARTLAEQSLVLLKNDGLLPLSRDVKTIAVIGPNADSVRNMVGDYAYPAHIESLIQFIKEGFSHTPTPEHMDQVEDFIDIVTVLEGIKRAVSSKTKVLYAKGCDVQGVATDGFAEAARIARRADVAIVVVGDKSGLTPDCTTGEFRDRTRLDLPGVQGALVDAVLATGTPTAVVLVNGRPVSDPALYEKANAVLEAWLPGEEGGSAVAGVLFGDVNPGGKLPVTVVRHAGQVPLFYGHRPSGAKSFNYGPYVDESNEPLFPFGFGLSYTTFTIGNLALDKTEVRADGRVRATVDVTNTGARAGDEVVQLYTRTDGASVTRPVKELRAFQRVSLRPGETKTVVFDLSLAQMAYYDLEMNLGVEPGQVTVMVGNSAHDVQASAGFTVVGPALRLRKRKVFFNKVSMRK